MQDKCKEQLQAIEKQQSCQSGAFDEQESFMLSRQCNTELGAFYSYLTLVRFRKFRRTDCGNNSLYFVSPVRSLR